MRARRQELPGTRAAAAECARGEMPLAVGGEDQGASVNAVGGSSCHGAYHEAVP